MRVEPQRTIGLGHVATIGDDGGMTRAIRGISAVAVIVGATAAMAEVPMHNPGLDHTCPKGFQYSRDTAACEQANCPARTAC